MGLPSSGSCRGCEGPLCHQHPTGCSDTVCPVALFWTLPQPALMEALAQTAGPGLPLGVRGADLQVHSPSESFRPKCLSWWPTMHRTLDPESCDAQGRSHHSMESDPAALPWAFCLWPSGGL